MHRETREQFTTRLFAEQFENLRRWIARDFGDDIADDAAQFAFVQVAAGKLAQDHPAPVAWLRTVARHEALYLVGKRDRAGSLDAPVDDAGNTVDVADTTADPALVAEVRENLDLLKRLKPAEAKVLFLLAAGWSYKEIAERLGQSYTWVNRYTTEGRAHLKRLAGGE